MDGDRAYLNAAAHQDYERAHSRVFLNDVAAFLGRQSNTLLSFEQVRDLLPISGQVDRGLQQVPLDAIRGSVDRYRDFDRNFLPRNPATRQRWERLDRAALAGEYVPPVQLYQVGNVYFVKDGNHRVSVARERGQAFIDANVIELEAPVPIGSLEALEEWIRQEDAVAFLSSTQLLKVRPEAQVLVTLPGQYEQLLEHIEVHRWFLGIEAAREIPYLDAVASWYDRVYLPIVEGIREAGMLREFPERTEADL